MAYNIATNPDTNVYDSEDYKELMLTGTGEAGRTTAGSMDFFILLIVSSVIVIIGISVFVWAYRRQIK